MQPIIRVLGSYRFESGVIIAIVVTGESPETTTSDMLDMLEALIATKRNELAKRDLP